MLALIAHPVSGLLPAHCLQMSHEDYIRAIADAAIQRIPDKSTRDRLTAAKLTYGAGEPGIRGITYFEAWHNGEHKPCEFVSVNATGEENPVQLAGTTVHELGHVLAGSAAGHGKEWKDACSLLGLTKAEAAGQCYSPEHFAPEILQTVKNLVMPTDGRPVFGQRGLNPFIGLPVATTFRPCPLGIGTKGGKSRGKGSGSRLRLYVCSCPVKVRVAHDNFQAHCDVCGSAFKREEQ